MTNEVSIFLVMRNLKYFINKLFYNFNENFEYYIYIYHIK